MPYWLQFILGFSALFVAIGIFVWMSYLVFPYKRRLIATPQPKPPGKICPRCSKLNLLDTNFCAQCGLMHASHNHVIVWLSDQKEMIRRREQLPKITIACDTSQVDLAMQKVKAELFDADMRARGIWIPGDEPPRI